MISLLVDTKIGPGFSGNSIDSSRVLSCILTCVVLAVEVAAAVMVVVAIVERMGCNEDSEMFEVCLTSSRLFLAKT